MVRSAKVLVMPEPSLNPDFWECDQMGVRTIAKCERCKKCQESGKCSDTHVQHTLKEQAELDLIRANTNLVNGEIWWEYPFVKDPACLSNNRDSAIKVAEKVWASLEREIICFKSIMNRLSKYLTERPQFSYQRRSLKNIRGLSSIFHIILF